MAATLSETIKVIQSYVEKGHRSDLEKEEKSILRSFLNKLDEMINTPKQRESNGMPLINFSFYPTTDLKNKSEKGIEIANLCKHYQNLLLNFYNHRNYAGLYDIRDIPIKGLDMDLENCRKLRQTGTELGSLRDRREASPLL